MFKQLLLITITLVSGQGYELKQVVVLSRHNIRSPIYNMESYTPKKWPTWGGNPGDLTSRGNLLEYHMGKYFSDWMIEKKLLNNNCSGDQVFIYANIKQRTKETAKAFVKGAFGDCVSVYSKNNTKNDPVFETIMRNASLEVKETILNQIQIKLNRTDFRNVLLEVNRIVDFGNSPYCKNENVCDLSKMKNEVVLEVNKEPLIKGGFGIAALIVEAFLMAYYDGMANKNIAWGQIQTTEQWNILLAIPQLFHELRFETKILDKDEASSLLEYLTDIFQNGKKKFYLLVGHDNNIKTLMSSLGFKDYILSDQLEKSPIGGKLVFQKWHDRDNDKYLLRINFVYQSTKEIRDGVRVTLQSPPHWQMLEMENCVVDKNGFCTWSDFISKLNEV